MLLYKGVLQRTICSNCDATFSKEFKGADAVMAKAVSSRFKEHCECRACSPFPL
jgi:hypothetical protein